MPTNAAAAATLVALPGINTWDLPRPRHRNACLHDIYTNSCLIEVNSIVSIPRADLLNLSLHLQFIQSVKAAKMLQQTAVTPCHEWPENDSATSLGFGDYL